MENKEILEIAEFTLKRFTHPIEKPVFEVMKKTKFVKYLKDSTIEANLEKTPAFVAHLPDGELIVFCNEIIEQLTSNMKDKRKFIEAVTMHELFHIWNKHRCVTSEEALMSEEEVHEEIKKEFPGLAKVLEKFE